MQNLTVSLLQRELAWENPEDNRRQFAADMDAISTDTDLVILPEMFTTGFSMRAEENAEDEARGTLPWLQQQAARHGCAITGSLPVRSNGRVFNRLLFVTPDGGCNHYDKRHLFRMSGEDNHYAAGNERLIVQWRDWRICPMVCYDLRFPVWTRNRQDYDLLLFVANWPAKRAQHWRQLLVARAIENQSYTIGLNRVGSDNNGLDYSGDSMVLAADGELLLDCQDHSGVFSKTLDAAAMNTYRRKFPVHKDADDFGLG